MSETFSITDTAKGNFKIPKLPFEAIKDFVLGKEYELSLAFVTEAESQTYNNSYRQKDYPTNILSFPLTENSGEIIICPAVAEKQAPDFDRKFENYIGFLFIHGLVHLKGFDHGSRMENEEERIRAQFSI